MIRPLAIFAAAVLALAVLDPACSRPEELPGGRPDAGADIDVSDLFRELMTRGPIAANDVRERLEAEDPGGLGAALAALLPAADEAWNVEVGMLVAKTPPDPAPAAEIVEPRGLRTPGGGRILVRRPMPGRVEMRVSRCDGGGDGEVSFDVAIGRWEPFPAELVLEPGARYSFTAFADEDVVATSEVATLTRADEGVFRERMKLLKRTVADARVRLYMQAVVAMSGGLFTEATEILTRRVGEPADSELGLHRRLVWLCHRRGRLDCRDSSLARLRE